jgi:hypothetical protein
MPAALILVELNGPIRLGSWVLRKMNLLLCIVQRPPGPDAAFQGARYVGVELWVALDHIPKQDDGANVGDAHDSGTTSASEI